MNKIILPPLFFLVTILLMGACHSKPSKSTQLVAKADSAVVDTPKFDLTSVVVPSLANELEEIAMIINNVGNDKYYWGLHDTVSLHVLSLLFYQKKGDDYLSITYTPWYYMKNYLPPVTPEPTVESGISASDMPDCTVYIDGHIFYKGVMFAFYNLARQGSKGILVDSTQINKGAPSHYMSIEEFMEEEENVPTYEAPIKTYKIHSKDSLELIRSYRGL